MNNNNLDDSHSSETFHDSEVVIPDKIKLELTTTLEFTTMLIFGLSILLTIMAGFVCLQTSVEIFRTILLSCIAINIFLFILYRNIDEYYVLDSKRQSLMLSRKIFSYESYTLYKPFVGSIDSVAVNGYYMKPKNSPGYWSHRPEIVLSNGKVIPIGDWKEKNYGYAIGTAKKFSKLTNVWLSSGSKQTEVVPYLVDGKYAFRRKVFVDSAKRLGFLIIVSCVVFAIGLGLILTINALTK